MAIPSMVRWDDVSAPQLTTAASSLIAVLDFALLSHGWTKEFSATDIAVYRAPLGNRKFYRVLDDNSVVYNGLYSAKVTAYDTMTDASTGSGWGAISRIRKAHSTGNKRWMVLVDDYGFMVVTQPAGATDIDINTYPMMPHYFGDDIPMMPGTASRAIMCAASEAVSYGGGTGMCTPHHQASGDARAASYAHRSVGGAKLNVMCFMQSPRFMPDVTNVICPAGNVDLNIYSYPYNGALLYTRPFMTDDEVTHSIGGYIPWLYYPVQKGNGFTSLADYSDGSKVFKAVRVVGVAYYGYNAYGTTSNYGAVLICTNESR